MNRLTSSLSVVAGVLFARVAEACPSCAGSEKGIGELVMLGSMIAAPYLVALLVVPAIRRLLSEEQDALAPVVGLEAK
jgi:hypothetical protein